MWFTGLELVQQLLDDLVRGHPAGDANLGRSPEGRGEDGGLREERTSERRTGEGGERCDGEAERYLVVVEVSVDGEAVLLLRLSLRGRLAPPLPPLDQRGVAHAAEEVGLGLQLGVLVPDGTQRRGLVDRRTFRKRLALILRC